MHKILKKFALTLATLAGMFIGSAIAQADDFAVVVNAGNTYSADDAGLKTQIKRLYLKESSSWPSGDEALPFGRADDSPEQLAFMKNVLGMSANELEGHWLKLKQISGETPPRAIGSGRILARQIGKNPGAFGIFPLADAQTIEGGKILLQFSDQ